MNRMGSSTLLGKITVLIAVCGWALSAQAKYDGGSGTQAEPYRISAVSDWQELMTTQADWESHFVLTADIDLNDVPMTPVGNYSNNFTGGIDGNDYVIRNADVNMPGRDYIGLFGYLGTDGEIKNLGVEDISIVGKYKVGGLVGRNWGGTISNCYSTGPVTGIGYGVGGLVGYNYEGAISNCYSTGSVTGTGSGVGSLVGENGGTISNCYSAGPVTGTGRDVGGLVGLNYATVSNCYSTGSITGRYLVGGLVGNNYHSAISYGAISNCYSTSMVSGDWYVGGLVGGNESTISNSYSTGSVTGERNVGGLVGWNHDDDISNCYSTGSVTGTGWSVGGLVGENHDGTVSNCYSTGSVIGGGDVGGLVGQNDRYGTITNCYSSGSVSGENYVGGLVGQNYEATITKCYSTGSVTGTDYAGGLVGYADDGTSNSSFWDVNTSGWTTSAGGTPKTTAEMKTQSTFTAAGWDFIDPWDIGENQTYPFIRAYLAGDINHDGVIDFRDIAHLAGDWLSGL